MNIMGKLLVGLGLALLGAFAQGAPEAAATAVTLNIPAQRMQDALNLLAKQAGFQVLFEVPSVRGKTSPKIEGSYTPEAALKLLLAGSELRYEVIGERVIAIRDARDAKEGERTSAGGKIDGLDRRSTQSVPGTNLQLASAAAAPAREQPATVEEDNAQEVVVNSTRDTGIVNQGIIPREENQAVRYDIISREDIERSGVTTMPELMRRLTSNQETGTTSQRAFQITVAATSNILGNGDQVNLRGLGTSQTAVMINGRRLYAGDSSGPDISRIPLSAVERIEVLPTSGSAIYGSSSVGGVINIVMRQGYRGTEATGYFGGASEGGAGEYRFDLFHGLSFNSGRTQGTLSVNLQHFDDLKRSDRDYDERMLDSARAAPGTAAYTSIVLPMLISRQGVILTSSPLGLGIPSDPSAQYAAIPAGSDGIGLTPTSFDGTANTANPSTDRIGRSKLRQESTSYAAMLNLEQAILGDSLSAYTELTYRKDDMPLYFPAGNASFSLSATDPRNPFRTDVTPGFVGRSVSVYRDPADLPDSYQGTVRTTLRGVFGLKGSWSPTADRSYHWAIDTSLDRNETETTGLWTSLILDTVSRAGEYNILRDLTGVAPLSATEADKFRYDNFTVVKPTIIAANFRLNGDLLRLPGGAAKFSLGSEVRREEQLRSVDYSYIGEYNYLPGGPGQYLFSQVLTDTDRHVMAMYGELEVPLIGPANRMSGLYSLDLSAGMRYEKYDDFKAAKPPLFALKWGVTPDVALRASWAEGFQPPAVGDLDPTVTAVVPQPGDSYIDALRPGATNPDYTIHQSGNPDLSAETAKTWDAGIILTPRALPGLTINASYFRYDKRGNVSSLSLDEAIESFPDLVVRGAPTAEDIAANRPGAVTDYYYKPVNIARQFTDGVDVELRYRLPAHDWGQLTFIGTGTWTDTLFTQSQPGQPEVSTLALAPFSGSFALRQRFNTTVMWKRSGLSASLTGSYTGKFESSTTTASPANPYGSGIDGDHLGGQWVLDTQVDYTVADAGPRTSVLAQWLGGTLWTVGVLNLADTEPALWTDRYRAFTSPFLDPRQRFVYFQVRKTF